MIITVGRGQAVVVSTQDVPTPPLVMFISWLGEMEMWLSETSGVIIQVYKKI